MVTLSDLKIVDNENQLPRDGKLVSFIGDDLEIPETQRKDMLAWDISHGDNKICWLLATRSMISSSTFMQFTKKAEKLGYKVAKKVMIEQNTLNSIYDTRTMEETQKATKDDSTVVAFFERILIQALKEGVSDVHIEARTNGAIIRMRKHGELMIYQNNMVYGDAIKLCSVIYNVLSENKDIVYDASGYQQSAVNYRVSDMELMIRFQSIAAHPGGFDVILRVLPIGKDEEFTPLQKLGYTDQQVKELINISSRPVGSTIIAGTTGSGKSTTLKNLIMFINAYNEYKLKIYTIEDPPEYKIPGVTQIPVIRRKNEDYSKKSPFEDPINACMRGDPDIIMPGEVRDNITASLTKKAIQSGHQVLTTVHASSAVGIIDRLLDFGLSRSVLASPDFLTGLVYQKLLAILCPHCSVKLEDRVSLVNVDKDDLDIYDRLQRTVVDLDLYIHNIRLRGPGCEHCENLGVVGRTVCAEIVNIDLKMLELILEGKQIELMLYWRSLSDGKLDSDNMRGKTAMEHAAYKMLQGEVSPKDIESSFKPLDEMLVDVKKEMQEIKDITVGNWSNL